MKNIYWIVMLIAISITAVQATDIEIRSAIKSAMIDIAITKLERTIEN